MDVSISNVNDNLQQLLSIIGRTARQNLEQKDRSVDRENAKFTGWHTDLQHHTSKRIHIRRFHDAVVTGSFRGKDNFRCCPGSVEFDTRCGLVLEAAISMDLGKAEVTKKNVSVSFHKNVVLFFYL